MRLAAWFCTLTAAALLAVNLPAVGQTLPPPASGPIAQLPPAPPEIDAPPLDYFDVESWLATSDVNPIAPRDDWQWQLLPDGIIYRAYLANPKESRLGTQIF